MSNTEKAKVLQFPQRGNLGSQELQLNQSYTTSTVHTLTPSSGLKIFWERDMNFAYSASSFFRVLFSQGRLTILCKDGEVTKDSILSVTDDSGEVFNIPVGYYVQLTAHDPNSITQDFDEHILSGLTPMGISVGMCMSDIETIETELQDDELDMYTPDKIHGIGENGEFYTCEIYHTKDSPIGYGEPDMFDTLDISLLDIILIALDDAEINDFDIRSAMLDVSYFEGDTTVVTTIPYDKLEYILYSALKRKKSLYQNMSLDKARKDYFFREVLEKIKY